MLRTGDDHAQGEGRLVKVATFCRGDQTMVPLKD